MKHICRICEVAWWASGFQSPCWCCGELRPPGNELIQPAVDPRRIGTRLLPVRREPT